MGMGLKTTQKGKSCKSCGGDRSDQWRWLSASVSCRSCRSSLARSLNRSMPCLVGECDRKRNGTSYCYVHAKDPKAPARKICRYCGGPVSAARHGKAACSPECTKALDVLRRAEIGCKIEDCQKPLASLGFCKMHLNRFKTWGDPQQTGPVIVCEMCGTSTFGVVSSQRLCSSPECRCEFAKLPESVRYPVADTTRLVRAERRREARAKDPDRHREVDRLWRQNNPDKGPRERSSSAGEAKGPGCSRGHGPRHSTHAPSTAR